MEKKQLLNLKLHAEYFNLIHKSPAQAIKLTENVFPMSFQNVQPNVLHVLLNVLPNVLHFFWQDILAGHAGQWQPCPPLKPSLFMDI